MTALKGLAHDVNVTDTFKAVIDAASHLHNVIDDILDIFRINKVSHAKLLTEGFAVRIQVDTDNFAGSGQFGSLDNIQSNTAKTEDSHS